MVIYSKVMAVIVMVDMLGRVTMETKGHMVHTLHAKGQVRIEQFIQSTTICLYKSWVCFVSQEMLCVVKKCDALKLESCCSFFVRTY